MSAVVDTHGHAHDHGHGHDHGHDHHGAYGGSCAGSPPPTTRTSARCTCGSPFTMFFVGGVMALLIRLELFQPGLQYPQPRLLQPARHHARADHDLRRHHAGVRRLRELADPDDDRRARHGVRAPEQLVVLAAAVRGDAADRLATSCPAVRPAAGWTLYAPLTVQQGIGMDFTIFAMHILGMSSILGSINIITTILNMRAPGMTLMRMPLFCWTWLITAYLLVAAMPVLAGAVTMTLTDRHFGTTSSTPRAAATRCSTSTSSGSSATPRSTSSRCRPSASSRR